MVAGSTLVSIFGPQHGYFQTEQDNMIETPDTVYHFLSDSSISLPLYSLYSRAREPSDQQLSTVDTLIVDLLDIGCRIYTYMYTLAACLRAASRLGKRVLVLDRPNPLGLSQKTAGGWLRVSPHTEGVS